MTQDLDQTEAPKRTQANYAYFRTIHRPDKDSPELSKKLNNLYVVSIQREKV